MQILKKWWFYIIVLVILIAFFIPKSAGNGRGSSFSGEPPVGQVWKEAECSCFGFKFELRTMDGPKFYSCSGIPFSCKCFEKKMDERFNIEQTEIVC